MAAEAIEPADLVATLQALELDGKNLPRTVRAALQQAAQEIDRCRAAANVAADTLDALAGDKPPSVMASGSMVDAWARSRLNTLREIARQLRSAT